MTSYELGGRIEGIKLYFPTTNIDRTIYCLYIPFRIGDNGITVRHLRIARTGIHYSRQHNSSRQHDFLKFFHFVEFFVVYLSSIQPLTSIPYIAAISSTAPSMPVAEVLIINE